jgi:sterol carrier protein 2
MAGARQVPNLKAALQHNIGLGGAVVVTAYKVGFPDQLKKWPANVPNPAIEDVPLSTAAGASKPAAAPVAGGSVDSVFAQLGEKVQADPSLVSRVKCVYQFNITGTDGKPTAWTVDLKNGSGNVKSGAAEKPDCTITMTGGDFIAMMRGKLNPQSAFMEGKIKLAGGMQYAMKLGEIVKGASKL